MDLQNSPGHRFASLATLQFLQRASKVCSHRVALCVKEKLILYLQIRVIVLGIAAIHLKTACLYQNFARKNVPGIQAMLFDKTSCCKTTGEIGMH